MSNPTRKEIKKVRKVLGESTFADICDFALRAHDMRDAVKWANDNGDLTYEDSETKIREAISEFDDASRPLEFDGAGDEQDPPSSKRIQAIYGEWGGGRTR